MSAARRIGIILICLWPLTGFSTTSATALYNNGNSLYTKGEFQEAVKSYEAARNTGVDNAALEYNLGNTYMKNDQLGKAILSYYRAHRLAPRDADIKFNLEFAKNQIRGEIPRVPQSSLSHFYDAALEFFTLGEISVILSAGWFILFAGWILRVMVQNPAVRKASNILIAAGMAVMLLSIFPVIGKARRELFTEPAIILQSTVDVYSGPGESNAKLFVLYEGMAVNITERKSDWCEIRAPGNLTGWIPPKTFESI